MKDLILSLLFLINYAILLTSPFVAIFADKADKIDVLLGFIIPYYGWFCFFFLWK
tara:strand:+ start:196 stop:360 length:165 start_codon:yes stop_codon:yes gene_type:complete